MGGYSDVVIKIPILVLPVLLCWWWMMMMMMWCSEDLQWWHASLQVGDRGLTVVWHLLGDEQSDKDLQWWCASFTSWWGGGGSSPATSPSWAMVWDHFHFPLVAPAVPPRYTLPNSSLESCLAYTSNIVQASLVVPPLKNLHLRWSQMAAARS